MPVLNPDIARTFDDIADLLEIGDAIAAPYAAALVRYLQNIPGVRRVLLAVDADADAHSIYDLFMTSSTRILAYSKRSTAGWRRKTCLIRGRSRSCGPCWRRP